jgi:multimeric flavodoxin WrbA
MLIPTGLPTDNQPRRTVLGFSGSPRKNGNSDILLQTVLAGAEQEGVSGEWYNLTGIQFTGCIGCEQCRRGTLCTGLIDGMSLLYPKILDARGLVLVSPTHTYNVTSWMKAFIDRLYCFYDFTDDRPRGWSSRLAGQHRKAVIAAVCEQESPEDMGWTLETMKASLRSLDYEIVGELAVFLIFDKGRVRQEHEVMDRALELGRQLARSL